MRRSVLTTIYRTTGTWIVRQLEEVSPSHNFKSIQDDDEKK